MREHATRVKITITSEIIETAIRNSSSHCMIADAIKAVRPDFKYVSVDIQTIRFTDPTTEMRNICLTPRILQQSLIDFDDGKRSKEVTCELRPSHILPAGVRGREKSPESKKNAKRRYMKAKLVREKGTGGGTGVIPLKVGGKAPPQMTRRREFGVRAYRGGSFMLANE